MLPILQMLNGLLAVLIMQLMVAETPRLLNTVFLSV